MRSVVHVTEFQSSCSDLFAGRKFSFSFLYSLGKHLTSQSRTDCDRSRDPLSIYAM